MYYDTETIYKEIQEMKSMLGQLLQTKIENNIKELSLSQLSKMWNKSSATIQKLVREQGLKAREIECSRSKSGKSLVFKVSDVLEFQRLKKLMKRIESEPVSIIDIAKREIKRTQEIIKAS